MPLQKQSLPINFAKGLDTKTDKFQVQAGNFLSLVNSVFTTGGQMQKRNGFGSLTSLPDSSNTFLTTFNGDLTAIGTSVNAYSTSSEKWVSKGSITPLKLNALPLIRNNTNQSQADVAVANGLVCTVYTDQDPSNLSAKIYKYAVADVATGQNLIAPTTITQADATYGTPRVYVVGRFFVVIFTNLVSATYHLKFFSISTVSLAVSTPADLSTTYVPSTQVAFDAVTANNSLYVGWAGTGTDFKITYLNSALQQGPTVTFTGEAVTQVSMTADTTGSTPVIWGTLFNSGGNTGYSVAVNPQLATILGETHTIAVSLITKITTVARNNILTIYYERATTYAYDTSIPSHQISKRTCTIAGVVSGASVVVRSVGLASKAFQIDSAYYFLSVYQSPYQNTYFLINESGNVIAKLAYENSGGYVTSALPNVVVDGIKFYTSYLIKDLIQAVNKNTNVPAGSQTAGIYSQTGINLAEFDLTTDGLTTGEIAGDLHFTGGFMWMYDGYLPVEHLFHLYPDSVEATWSATGGSIAAQPDGATNTNAYYYQVTYEWTDNQGNSFKSAPSIPVAVTTTGALSTGSITINVPTLRLTYKIANPVKIVIYRWSAGQQSYYQTTSITAPTLNSVGVDYITYVDTLADSSILGNNLIYTTGGVLENIAAPAIADITLFQSRLFCIYAEDRNTVGFSKIVIENTPVEMSDQQTLFIAPTIGAQGSTGPLSLSYSMDDKLILFKENAMYYITGTGPDITGAGGSYSDPVFITATVGCTNKKSIVFMPNGLMFQSSKGIWLLGRDMSTKYIGAPVEAYNSSTVTSAINVPGTNQVRFSLDTGEVLMYDYYYDQWGIFKGARMLSSTLFQDQQTYIDTAGAVYQETPGKYLDASVPVLMSFTTSWFNLAGLQGFQRFYYFYLLGVYLSPHKLNIKIAYNYNANNTQATLVTPVNANNTYGDDTYYGGGSPYGGESNIEQWRIFPNLQKCESFQITIDEIYNSSLGQAAGAGLTLSGLNLIIGAKKSYTTLVPGLSAG